MRKNRVWPVYVLMSHRVFISYASEDEKDAMEIRSKLESVAVACWLAPIDIRSGSKWAEAIVDAIRSSELLVLVLSPHAVSSPHVKTEVGQAFDLNRPGKRLPILPFLVGSVQKDHALTYMLRGIQTLDATSGLRGSIVRLCQDVLAHLGTPSTVLPGRSGRLKIVISHRQNVQPDDGASAISSRRR